MGYYTRIAGEFRIEPPLTLDELQGCDFLPEYVDSDDISVMVKIEEQSVSTAEGLFVKRSGVALLPASESGMKAYGVVDDVQRFVDAYGSTHALVGRFDCRGEDAGDLWRLEIHDGHAVQVRPRIVWSDGTEEPTR